LRFVRGLRNSKQAAHSSSAARGTFDNLKTPAKTMVSIRERHCHRRFPVLLQLLLIFCVFGSPQQSSLMVGARKVGWFRELKAQVEKTAGPAQREFAEMLWRVVQMSPTRRPISCESGRGWGHQADAKQGGSSRIAVDRTAPCLKATRIPAILHLLPDISPYFHSNFFANVRSCCCLAETSNHLE